MRNNDYLRYCHQLCGLRMRSTPLRWGDMKRPCILHGHNPPKKRKTSAIDLPYAIRIPPYLRNTSTPLCRKHDADEKMHKRDAFPHRILRQLLQVAIKCTVLAIISVHKLQRGQEMLRMDHIGYVLLHLFEERTFGYLRVPSLSLEGSKI